MGVASLRSSLAKCLWLLGLSFYAFSPRSTLEVWERRESGRLWEEQRGGQGQLLGTEEGFTLGRNGF